MPTRHDPIRRVFIASGAVTAAAVLAMGTAGCTAANIADRKLVFKTLDEALREMDRLAAADGLATGTGWSLPQTLAHIAQSIEHSISGFPQARSALFQNTVGAAARRGFAWRQRMTHDLGAAIPGAPSLDDARDPGMMSQRVHDAVQVFRRYQQPLPPHFAYGGLAMAQYEQAHAMHMANHFSAIDV